MFKKEEAKIMNNKNKGDVYLITSEDSGALIRLHKWSNDKLENLELCAFLGITEKNKYDFYIDGWRRNQGTPSEVKKNFKHGYLMYAVTTNFKHLVIITNNPFVINELNIYIRLYYKAFHLQKGKLNKTQKEWFLPKEKVKAFDYDGNKFTPIKVTEFGINTDNMFKKELDEQNESLSSLGKYLKQNLKKKK